MNTIELGSVEIVIIWWGIMITILFFLFIFEMLRYNPNKEEEEI